MVAVRNSIALEIYRDWDSSTTLLLYCFVRRRDNTGWSLWKLAMPKVPPRGALNTTAYPYPSPCDWYLAEGRTYGGFYTFDDYEVYTTSSEASEGAISDGFGSF